MYRRRSLRDKAERARTQKQIDTQWDRDVKPMYLKYVKPSAQLADIIVNNDRAQIITEPDKIPQINIVLTYIANYLGSQVNNPNP